jgi:hypothetical protein
MSEIGVLVSSFSCVLRGFERGICCFREVEIGESLRKGLAAVGRLLQRGSVVEKGWEGSGGA